MTARVVTATDDDFDERVFVATRDVWRRGAPVTLARIVSASRPGRGTTDEREARVCAALCRLRDAGRLGLFKLQDGTIGIEVYE